MYKRILGLQLAKINLRVKFCYDAKSKGVTEVKLKKSKKHK